MFENYSRYDFGSYQILHPETFTDGLELGILKHESGITFVCVPICKYV